MNSIKVQVFAGYVERLHIHMGIFFGETPDTEVVLFGFPLSHKKKCTLEK